MRVSKSDQIYLLSKEDLKNFAIEFYNVIKKGVKDPEKIPPFEYLIGKIPSGRKSATLLRFAIIYFLYNTFKRKCIHGDITKIFSLTNSIVYNVLEYHDEILFYKKEKYYIYKEYVEILEIYCSNI